jgi:CheY-like chemotaxis protein
VKIILINQEIAKALLEDRKVIVSTAEDGKRAAEMFRDSPPRYYDADLMDIRMPVMDGYEATGADPRPWSVKMPEPCRSLP